MKKLNIINWIGITGLILILLFVFQSNISKFADGYVTIYGDDSLVYPGEIRSYMIHGLAYKDSTSITVDIVTRYKYVRLRPLMNIFEADGLTFVGDSIIIISPGHYYIGLGSSLIALSDGCFFTTTGTNNFQSVHGFGT